MKITFSAARHDVLSNPIEHLHADETLFSDEDDNGKLIDLHGNLSDYFRLQ